MTIVSNNPETLDGLAAYLREAGVAARGTRHIGRSSELTWPTSSAIVLFPDDFSDQAVEAALADLRLCRPAALRVLVTSHPKRFDRFGGDERLAPLVVPKPVWGWSILDAIRAHLADDPAEGGSAG